MCAKFLWCHGLANRQTDRTGGVWVQSPFGARAEQTDRQTDRQSDRQTVRQTDIQTCRTGGASWTAIFWDQG